LPRLAFGYRLAPARRKKLLKLSASSRENFYTTPLFPLPNQQESCCELVFLTAVYNIRQ
jgi:hypothetical protein